MTLERPAPQDIVIVGASGDLSRRKLLPALFRLHAADLLPNLCQIIGFSRSDLGDEGFRKLARQAIEGSLDSRLDEGPWQEFAGRLRYVRADETGPNQMLSECAQPQRVFYLAVPPEAVPHYVELIGRLGLAKDASVVIEKPFGTDLESARALSRKLHDVFDESQIFRIDHYLGKETVQNLLVFRFANAVFERVWNRDAIEEIQITVAETLGTEGRGESYEGVGALRDILQNHVLQMLALLTMEAPASLDAEAIRDEKVKLLSAISPVNPADVVRGQYTTGVIDGQAVPGYREEPGVAPDSDTETFVALRLFIDNWRWAGVPIFLRTGKRMASRATELDVAFEGVPGGGLARLDEGYLHANHLTHLIQPDEEIIFRFLAKEPGPNLELKQVDMSFSYEDAFMVQPAEAYERLIHDVLQGDRLLFVREDAIERSWQIVEPVLRQPPPLLPYPAGTWGPEEAERIVAPHQWHLR
jgi:glucose-6-phosphate 1-dehydrogenase